MSKKALPITVKSFNGKLINCVDSHDVYGYLDKMKNIHTTWIKQLNGKENIDYIKGINNNSVKYYLSVAFSKKIANHENSISLSNYLNNVPQQDINITEQLEKQIKDNKEKIDFFDTVSKSDNLITIGTFAKLIGWGEKRFFRQLRYDKFLCSSPSYYNTPYQKYIENGMMDIRQTYYHIGEKVIFYNQPMITQKGQVHLAKKYSKR